jgi:cell division protein FtsB
MLFSLFSILGKQYKKVNKIQLMRHKSGTPGDFGLKRFLSGILNYLSFLARYIRNGFLVNRVAFSNFLKA